MTLRTTRSLPDISSATRLRFSTRLAGGASEVELTLI
jgi:hypothetical protein